MRSFLILALLFTIPILVSGQKSIRVYPFDSEKFKEQLRENNRFQTDSFNILRDSVLSKLNESNSIRTYKVPEKEMARIPNMPFKKDVHYTMRIKKYELNYPYTKETLPRGYEPTNDYRLYRPLKDRKK